MVYLASIASDISSALSTSEVNPMLSSSVIHFRPLFLYSSFSVFESAKGLKNIAQ